METDIAVTDKETSQVLGYACSNTLNLGAFANFPISADLDQNGAGKITVGPNTYLVHEDSEVSGGITCGRMYNDVETFMTCAVSVPASLQLTPLSKSDITSCFTSGTASGLQAAANSIDAGNAPL